ncbi:SDR family NAD(P)-dependent oxidoreductase [Alteribacillus bidgolensis]|uniref:3-oxoacyl-[acyl-carrier protein] reductase n=1 Tax=Alteribacillus bidgolensis TaxID=930129 RepID=A0A1G8QUI0_9BACI|nr:SDR family NAD(P)-dependent oxidoreductase [Alteribacillus bidgolensis]SDJ08372.1 3-oxoacyl-[acyl-carrier protein] reductase [Alteribacillus bidgolensis]
MRFKNKVVLVTGAARGIGRGIAERFTKEGASVAINDVNTDLLQETVTRLNQKGGKVMAVAGDVSNEEAVAEMLDMIVDEFGTVDILVNNAGISPRKNGQKVEVENLTSEAWDQVMAVNLRSQFLTSRAVITGMKRNNWGRIINVSSQAARIRPADFCGAEYIASKAGVLGLTRCLAVELSRYGINVNSVCPGLTESDMLSDVKNNQTSQYTENVPVGRLGTPKDLAHAVLFLADPYSDFITGTALDVNGGYFMV